MSGFNIKHIFQQEMMKTLHNGVFNPKLRKHTFQEKLFFMSGFDAKRIFQPEVVNIRLNASFKSQWSKTPFLRKSCISGVDLM